MNIKLLLYSILLLCLSACVENAGKEYTSYKHLIEVEELITKLSAPHWKVIAFCKPASYAQGHIDGALSIWRTDIEDASYAYGGMMAQRDTLAARMGRWGIDLQDTLVVYDHKGACDAARFWWVLQQYGFDQVKILNGGIQAWKEVGNELSTTLPHISPTRFQFPPNPPYPTFISKEVLHQKVTQSPIPIVIDTRNMDEYSGKRQKKGASKAGHIPHSHMIDWIDAVDEADAYRFRPYKALEKVYQRLENSQEDTIIVYCHTGVRSAHTTFVLTQLMGYKYVQNYDGSWTEWSYFDHLPFVQDSTTRIFQ